MIQSGDKAGDLVGPKPRPMAFVIHDDDGRLSVTVLLSQHQTRSPVFREIEGDLLDPSFVEFLVRHHALTASRRQGP